MKANGGRNDGKDVMQAKSPLPDAIRQLNPQPMSDGEAEAAARNLAGFMSLLLEIEQEQASASRKEGKRQ